MTTNAAIFLEHVRPTNVFFILQLAMSALAVLCWSLARRWEFFPLHGVGWIFLALSLLAYNEI